MVNAFQEILRIPTVLMGFALPDDGMHAPNEKFHLPNFFRGIETSFWFLDAISRLAARAAPYQLQDEGELSLSQTGRTFPREVAV